MKNNPKVALVADWLTEGFGGGERVIKAVHELFPDAPIYTSQYRPERTSWLGKADVRTGWLNGLPTGLRRFVPFLRQLYFSRLNLSDYDVVISITGAEAKGVKTGRDTLNISYMHAPTQYYWGLYNDYIKDPGFGLFNPLARLMLKMFVGPLRRADYRAGQRPDVIVSNSSYIQGEIKKYYKRDSVVIWPNVNIENIQKIKTEKNVEREGFITFGRQATWKRMDLSIAAAIETNEKLKIIGAGPEHERLVKQAAGNPNIEFLPSYSDIKQVMPDIRSSKAFLFTSIEPFGIAPVEALAAGTPLIALKKGGALDFVTEGKNGVFFNEQTVESLASAIKKFNKLSFNEEVVANSAKAFSEVEFKAKMQELITKKLAEK